MRKRTRQNIEAIWRCIGAYDHPQLIKELDQLDDPRKLNRPSRSEETPLTWAVDRQNYFAAAALLKKGADPNLYSPLRYATFAGPLSLVKLLIEYGANPYSLISSKTAIDIAFERENYEAIDFFVNQGYRYRESLYYQAHQYELDALILISAAVSAVQQKDIPQLKGILEGGFDPNIPDPVPLLHRAIMHQFVYGVPLLIARGANVNYLSKDSITGSEVSPLLLVVRWSKEIANRSMMLETADILLQSGADPLLECTHQRSNTSPLREAEALPFPAMVDLMNQARTGGSLNSSS